jgi:hypothetical protein
MDDQESKSKKPSDTKQEQHDDIVYFVDRCLGRGLWTAMRAAGFKVEHKDDHFAQNTDDQDWMPKVGSLGWVVLTRDTRIRLHPHERDAVLKANLRFFSLQTKRGKKGERRLTGNDMTELFMDNMAKIEAIVRTVPGPFIAGITRSGVRIMYPTTTEQ